MKNIAFYGHSTRSSEIVNILTEIYGASNPHQWFCNVTSNIYYVENGQIECTQCENECGGTILTLEEFEKSQINKTTGNYESPVMTQSQIDEYFKNHSIKNAQNLLDIEKILNQENLVLPECVVNPNGVGSIDFIRWFENRLTTYQRCQRILDVDEENYQSELLGNFKKLLICRDAYWKRIGDWRPDWTNSQIKYIITYQNDTVLLGVMHARNIVLAFPSISFRDEFYNNFKDLIESCKELL